MDILIKPEQLRKTADELTQSAKKIYNSLNKIDEIMESIGPERFSGVRADHLRKQYQTRREQLFSASELVGKFSAKLDILANEFEGADNKIGGAKFNLLPGLLEKIKNGDVLGISEAAEPFENQPVRNEYIQMRYHDRVEEYSRLEMRRQQLLQLVDPDKASATKNELTEVEELIKEKEAHLAEAEKGSEAILNKLIPTLPLEKDADGVPWRVKADDYEDEVAKLQEELAELNKKKENLQNILANEKELIDINEKQTELKQLIEKEGIPSDGPTAKYLLNDLAGCTRYVATKRDVISFPNDNGEPGHPRNAMYWDDQAKDAGYSVGKVPVIGSVVVFEPGSSATSSNVGHVGYVEKVTIVDGGYKVEYSQADTIYTNAAKTEWVRGDQTKSYIGTITIPFDGADEYTSFIYDKN